MTGNIIDALNSVCWYNGYDCIVKETIQRIKEWDKDDVFVPFRDIVHIPDEYEGALIEQIVWMLCVLMFGDYGTSPRGGWVEDRGGAIAFLEKLIADRPEEEG